jgi:vitamin B12 transporter
MRRYFISVFSLALVFLMSPLFSDEQQKEKSPAPAEHHEVVVTATRIETPVREVASSVTVISGDVLTRLKRAFVLEAVRDCPGVSIIQNGGPGEAASVFIRGANSEHTLVLVDGIEVNDPINPSRSADLAHLALGNIDRLEILRGPQSPLYGSDAIGGILNIITKKGAGKPKFSFASSGGSYGTFSNQAAVAGSAKALDYSLGISQFKTNGISAASSVYPGNSENDGYANLTFSGRLGLRLRENLEFSLITRSIFARTDIDNSGGPYGDDPNSVQDYRSYLIRAEMRGLFLKNRWEQKLRVAVVDSRRDHNNPPDEQHPLEAEKGHFEGGLLKLDWQNNFFLHPSNTLTVGVEQTREKGRSEYSTDSSWGSFSSPFPLHRAETTGLYVQDYIRWRDRLFAAVGLRFDHHSQSGEALTYRLAPAYIFPTTRTKIRASLGTGFKSPSLYQLHAPPTLFGPIGNVGLKPEKSLGWDAGIEQPFCGGRMHLAATYFHNDFQNLIDFDIVQGYVNIGKAESQGVEIELEARPRDALLVTVVYTYLEARDKIEGTALLRRPRNSFSAALSYSLLDKWSVSLSLGYTGRRDDMSYLTWSARRVTLTEFTLLNSVISYDLSRQVQLFGRLDNILDQKYELVYGYGTPGFSIQGGFRLAL